MSSPGCCRTKQKLTDQQTKIEPEKSPGSQDAGPSCRKNRGMSKLGKIDTKEADIVNVKKPRNSKKKKIQESRSKLKNKYSCEKCARSFAQKGRLNKHKKSECGVKPQFSCKFCDKPFKLKGAMKNHILRVHQKTSPKAPQLVHKCKKCSGTYRSKRALNEHIREEHEEFKPQFTCDFCGFQAKRKRYLPQHIALLHLSKQESLNNHKKLECDVIPQFRCKFCDKPFKLKGTMKNHILRVHLKTSPKTSQMLHKCNNCSRTYRSIRALNEHIREKHAAVKPQFTCDFCGFQMKRKRYLQEHITLLHLSKQESLNNHKKFECDDIPQFRCKFCDKPFKLKGVMKNHILRVHLKPNPKASQMGHTCNKCSGIYLSLRALNEHVREEHKPVKRQFTCDFCGFEAKRKRYLQEHITLLHLSKQESSNNHKKFECDVIPQFRCKFCGKPFKLKGTMKSHILRLHLKSNSQTSQVVRKCYKCARTYRSLGALNDHIHAEHAAVTPQFTCDICGFQVKRKRYLPKHIALRHLSKDASLNNHKKFECDVIPQFRCKFCDKCFNVKSNMKRHILAVHQKTDSKVEKQFTCDFCGYKAKLKHNLSKHIISLHIRKNVCGKCGYRCSQKEHFVKSPFKRGLRRYVTVQE